MTKRTDGVRTPPPTAGQEPGNVNESDGEFLAVEIPGNTRPGSGFRLPLPCREELDDYGKSVYDRLTDPQSRLVAGLRGPAGIRLHSPKLAEITNALSHYLRYETGFDGAVRELAILVTAREMDSQFEWVAHHGVALKEGVAPETIEIVKYRKSVEGLPETEAIIVTLGRQMFGKKHVDPETFGRALKIFGPRQLVDIVSLMGYYAATASLLIAFDMQLVEGQKPTLPQL